MTTYNLSEKTGEKIPNPQKLYRKAYNNYSAEEKKNFTKNSQELGHSMMGNFGGSVQQSSAKILGYDCDVTTMGGMSTVYLLHGTDIPLKSEVAVMGMTSTNIATRIDSSAAVPDSAFTPPVGISAQLNQEMEAMMAETIHQVMDTLRRPDGAKVMQQSSQGMMPAGATQQGMGGGTPADQAAQQQMLQDMEATMKKFNQQKSPQ